MADFSDYEPRRVDQFTELSSVTDNDLVYVEKASDSRGRRVKVKNILPDGAVTSDKLATHSVTGLKIAPNAVGNDAIADGVVNTQHITPYAVTTEKLANNAVTNLKIAANAVGNAELSDGAVTESKIAPLNVSTGKIASNAVTSEKLASDVRDTIANKANIDGYYDEMAVGSAEQLLSNTYIPDSAPYLFRTSGGSLEIGDRVYEDAIVGGSVAWNQLWRESVIPSDSAIYSSSTYTANNVTFTKNGDGSISVQTTAEGASTKTNVKIASYSNASLGVLNFNHYIRAVGGSLSTAYINYASTRNIDGTGKIYSPYSSEYNMWIEVPEGAIITTPIKIYPQVHNLDIAFGTSIATYAYTLESSEAGSGIAWLKSYGFFTEDYYAYNAGGIESVKTSAKKVVGFNLWNGEYTRNSANQIQSKVMRVVGGQTYRLDAVGITTVYGQINFYCYDINKVTIPGSVVTTYSKTFLEGQLPTNCAYVKFELYRASGVPDSDLSKVCFHFKWDDERDGEYEAYEEHTYPLDSDLELRGIPKLVDGKIKYNGDTYESDGTVTRKYGIVDLGTLNWGVGGQGNRDFLASYSDFPIISTTTKVSNIVSTMYKADSFANVFNNPTDKTCGFHNLYHRIYVANFDYTDVETFKTAMSGQYLVFELATPTTESADPYTSPQWVDNWGTEEFVDTRDVPVPVGHESRYLPDLKAKLESAPNNPSTNGKYFLQYENGEASYVPVPSEVPQTPSEDGTYVLKATVTSGVATLAWVAEE